MDFTSERLSVNKNLNVIDESLHVYEARPRPSVGCGTAHQMRLATSSKCMRMETISRSRGVFCSRHVALPA